MRILHSIRSVNPEGGGVVEAVKQVSKIHQESGHAVEILSLDSPDDPWVKEFPLWVRAAGPGRGKFGFTAGLVPWLRKHARDYDAVVVNGIWQYNSFAVWRALRDSSIPYFVFPHGMLDPWFKRTYPLKHLKKWLYWPWSDYRVLRDACAVLFTCEEERRLARQSFWLYRCREQVVGLGIAAPGGDPQNQRSLFFQRFPELRDKRIVLFLGRIHSKKGCDLLIRAFARLFRDVQSTGFDHERLHLVIAGPDHTGWLPELRKLAETLGILDRITWPGMLTGEMKVGALRSAEVFVLPSHQENFGLAVAESLACSLPVLISNKVNIWREIERGGAGLVGNDDEQGTSSLLQRWFSLNKAEQQAYCLRAHNCFASRFEIRRTANALVRLLQSQRPHNGSAI
jgi:glycosyltransferase involved in cell wall biosynthesis